MACANLKPVVAIYSTFLQRAYDQLIHDVALQNLKVIFAIDRAGLVGEDGPTHAGSYDLAFLRCIPNMVIMTPSDENELWNLLTTAYYYDGPTAIRYPRGKATGCNIIPASKPLPMGKSIIATNGEKTEITFLVFGTLLKTVLKIAKELHASVINMRFAKPLDKKTIISYAKKSKLIVTIEDGVVMGGAGSGVNEIILQENIMVSVLNLGYPDSHIEHASQDEMNEDCNLSASKIKKSVITRLKLL